MSNPIKVFSRVYVGFKEQYQYEGEDAPPPLGFLTPYEETPAGKKRIETVDSWAKPYDQYRYDPIKKEQYLFKKGEVIPAKILDNVALEGFEICREVKRTGWNGGNVVWRILDPRGFELEISSANLAKILTFANIDAGKIHGKCIWGRLGAANLLMPEGCPEFANIIPKAEEFKKAKVLKERTVPNSEVKIGNYVMMHNGHKGFYLGKWNILVDRDYDTVGGKVLIRHLIGDDKGEIRAISELRVMEILATPNSSCNGLLKAASLEQELNRIKELGAYGSADSIKPRLICKGKIPLEQVKVSLQQFDLNTYLDHLRKTPVQAGNHVSNLFRIRDFKKTPLGQYDYKSLFVIAKLKDGRYFTTDNLEVSQQRGQIVTRLEPSYESKVDVWPLSQSPVRREPTIGSVVIPERAKESWNRRKFDMHGYSPFSGQDYYCNSFAYGQNVTSSKNSIIKFFEDNVEEILFYEFSFETPDGELITNVYYD